MATPSLAFNPIITTNGAGSFNVSSSGFIAGTAYPGPAQRYELSGGVLATTETIPMWGGVGISELVPTPGSTTLPERALGTIIGRATTQANAYTAGALTGFSVFDQANAMVNNPQSPVPMASTGMSVNFYRFGSNARIALPCSPSLVSVEGNPIGTRVSWDFVNQLVVPYTPGYSANTITGAVWAATNGGQITFTVVTDQTTTLAVGDEIVVSGVVNSPASPNGFNGTWIVTAVTSTTIVVAATSLTSVTAGTYSSAGSVNAALGGALAVQILDIDIGNSMVPVYNSTTGFCTWNRSGSAVLVKL